MNVEETESAGGQGEAMDKRAKGERDEDNMAEMIIGLLGKRNEPFFFGFENHFPFPLVFPSFPPPY